jgi:hypothetical protein
MKKLTALIHGENPTVLDIALIHLPALFFGVFTLQNDWILAQKVIYVLLCWDIIGGVIANISASTKTYWQKQAFSFRVVFYIAHIAQPLILHFVFGWTLLYALALYSFVLLAGIVLLTVKKENNPILSLAFTAFGILNFSVVYLPTTLGFLAILYIIKLTTSHGLRIE